jgi:hypothetical protein
MEEGRNKTEDKSALDSDSHDSPIEIMDINELSHKNFHGCNSTMANVMIESASVCFNKHFSEAQVSFSVTGDFSQNFVLKYKSVDNSMIATYNDADEAAEKGAYAIAFCIIEKFTGLKPMLKSAKDNGFDYHMGYEAQDDFLNFSPIARLEVSGILKVSKNNSMEKRYNSKVKQIQSYSNDSPAYVVIVGYNESMAKVGAFNA